MYASGRREIMENIVKAQNVLRIDEILSDILKKNSFSGTSTLASTTASHAGTQWANGFQGDFLSKQASSTWSN